MENFTLVRPEHLNHHGYLFGGVMLKWVDENTWMAATRDFPGSTLVTIAMNDIRFTQRVHNGSTLRFKSEQYKLGRTSVTYSVHVFAVEPEAAEEYDVFNTQITFVRLNEQGRPCPLQKP